MNALVRLYTGRAAFDFVRIWRVTVVVSLVAVVVSIGGLLARGLDLGFEFEGGTSWTVPATGVEVATVRDALRPAGLDSARIQLVGQDTLQVQAGTADETQVAAARSALAELTGVDVEEVAVAVVGPSWGDEVSAKALRALVLFLVAIAAYITIVLRDWRMAAGAVIAVAHDVVLSVGVYALAGIEVTPATVIAFLTILGFSLYDTVVVFSRMRENTPMVSIAGRVTYAEMASLSSNQSLLRAINTSLTTMLPLAALLVVGAWVLGATTLQEFSVALLIGLAVGAYSSLFLATPITVWLNERTAANRALRAKLGSAERRADADATSGAAGRATTSGTGTVTFSANHPPRPRRKRRR